MKKFLLILVIPLLFSNCTTMKTIKFSQQGKIDQKEFYEEIPFEYRSGLMVIDVEVEGDPYKFAIDTGAPNVVSFELAEILNKKPKFTSEVSGSTGQKSEMDFIVLEKVSIGGIDFLKTGAVEADLNGATNISCLGIDGLIGANLMRKAIWKFDFDRQVVVISNTLDAFEISDSTNRIEFKTNLSGTPKIGVEINGEVGTVTVDTGSNGGFRFSKSMFNKPEVQEKIQSKTIEYGSSLTGVHGKSAADTTYHTLVSEIKLGDIELNDKTVRFSKERTQLLGMEFFKNYEIIFNWSTKEMLLSEKKEWDNSTLVRFGFEPGFEEDKIVIDAIYDNSEAKNVGLQLKDHIVELNGKNIKEISKEDWCTFRLNGALDSTKTVNITVERDGETLTYDLTKGNILD